jgi:hypothetical protein
MANAHFENLWLARLSNSKSRRLRGLESHPHVCAAFDSLLALPAMRVHGMQIGSIPEVLAMTWNELRPLSSRNMQAWLYLTSVNTNIFINFVHAAL